MVLLLVKQTITNIYHINVNKQEVTMNKAGCPRYIDFETEAEHDERLKKYSHHYSAPRLEIVNNELVVVTDK